MEFYLNNRKHFGNTIFVLFDCLATEGILLTYEDQEKLIDVYINNEFPQEFYKNNILNLDKILTDPECIYDFVE